MEYDVVGVNKEIGSKQSVYLWRSLAFQMYFMRQLEFHGY